MAKAVLVMDMPKCCYQCPCFSITECRAYKCGTKVDNDRTKPYWCPLKPMPEKREEKYAKDVGLRDSGFIDGWNACIDAICGKE